MTISRSKWILTLTQKVFHRTKVAKAPLQPEELMELEEAFKTCEGCPIGIIFKTLMEHIRWQEHHYKMERQNYDK